MSTTCSLNIAEEFSIPQVVNNHKGGDVLAFTVDSGSGSLMEEVAYVLVTETLHDGGSTVHYDSRRNDDLAEIDVLSNYIISGAFYHRICQK